MNPHSRWLGLLCLTMPVAAGAQVRASEIGTMSQMIDGTKITVEYSRPRARGRDPIFGTRAVHWDEVWTPGANWATTFDVNKTVKLNGRTVPKGKYSMWMVVKQDSTWTIVLDPKVRIYHMDPPDSNATQVRFTTRVKAAPFTDVLTFSMPELRMNGGTLTMQWERITVPIDVEVEPSLSVTMPEADAKPFLGTYAHTETSPSGKVTQSTLTVTYENGTLKGEWTPTDPYFRKFALIRVTPDWFVPGIYDKSGQVYEVLRPEMTLEFKRVGGRAVSYEVREEDDRVSATGRRTP
jgi:hypothetical protein